MKLDGYSFGPFASVDLNALNQRLVVLARACREITDAADAAKRDLTAAEDARLSDLIFQSESVEALKARMEGENEYTPRQGTGRRTTAQGPNDIDYSATEFPFARAQRRETPSTGLILGKTKEGKIITGYRPNESLPVSGPQLDYDLGMWARAAYSGDWASIRAQSQTEGVGADGGFLVPPRLSQSVIEFIRNQASVIRAGAITTVMDSSSLSFARQISDPTVGWRGELVALPASKITFDMVNFRAHSIGCTITLSEEIIMDAPNLTQILETALSAKMALAFDESFLLGDGVGKPLGVTVADGVQTLAAVGDLQSIGTGGYSPFSEAAGKLWAQNFTPTGLLYNGKTAWKVDDLKDMENRPLQPNPSFNSYPKFVTNQLPEVANVSTAILADWSHYLIAMRTNGVRIDFSKDATVNNIPAFQNLAVQVRCWARLDGMPVRPNAFVLLPGILTTP